MVVQIISHYNIVRFISAHLLPGSVCVLWLLTEDSPRAHLHEGASLGIPPPSNVSG